MSLMGIFPKLAVSPLPKIFERHSYQALRGRPDGSGAGGDSVWPDSPVAATEISNSKISGQPVAFHAVAKIPFGIMLQLVAPEKPAAGSIVIQVLRAGISAFDRCHLER